MCVTYKKLYSNRTIYSNIRRRLMDKNMCDYTRKYFRFYHFCLLIKLLLLFYGERRQREREREIGKNEHLHGGRGNKTIEFVQLSMNDIEYIGNIENSPLGG